MKKNDFHLDGKEEFFPARVLVVRPTFSGEIVQEHDYLFSVEGQTHQEDVNAPQAGKLYIKVTPGQMITAGDCVFTIVQEGKSVENVKSTTLQANNSNSVFDKLYTTFCLSALVIIFYGGLYFRYVE